MQGTQGAASPAAPQNVASAPAGSASTATGPAVKGISSKSDFEAVQAAIKTEQGETGTIVGEMKAGAARVVVALIPEEGALA